MGANRFFWPQELLDQWIVEDKITLKDDSLTIVSEKRTFQTKQAVYFSADVSDGQDTHNFVGRVKELSVLEEMGAEYYMDSVIMEDSAYEVVPGFTGEPEAGKSAGAMDLSAALAGETGEGEANSDRELLAKFLLENL